MKVGRPKTPSEKAERFDTRSVMVLEEANVTAVPVVSGNYSIVWWSYLQVADVRKILSVPLSQRKREVVLCDA